MNIWTEHHGGPMPCSPDTWIEVEYLYPPREGQFAVTEMYAAFFDWRHTDENDDIIAWREVVQ